MPVPFRRITYALLALALLLTMLLITGHPVPALASPRSVGGGPGEAGPHPVSASQPAPVNLLVNADFEAQWRGWRFSPLGVGTGNMHAQAARSGSFGALLRGSGRIAQVVSSLSPNTSYTLSGFARALSAGSPTTLEVSGFGGATVRTQTTGDQWEALSLRFTTGPQATSATIAVVAALSDDRIHYADALRLSPAAPATPDLSTSRVGRQYETLELTLQATRAVANPYREVRLTATFISPSGRSVRAEGFWDGGTTWRLRFTPTEPGIWRYQLTSTPADPGLSEAGTLSVSAARSGQEGFVRVDGRSFVYDSGRPFFMLGTTAYTLARSELGGGDWRAFLDGSLAHGITKLRTLVYPWNDPRTLSDQSPFLANDHDQPDLAYWQALDRVIAEATGRSLIVDLILFADEKQAFGSVEQDTRYVRTVLARYAANPRVIWTLSNEWEYTGKPMSYWNSLGDLVMAEDPYVTNAQGQRRPLSIHNKTGGAAGGRFAFTGLEWPTHAIVQWGVRNDITPHGDEWGQWSILRNTRLGMPVVNDEISYLGEQDPTPAGLAVMDRTSQRQSLWGAYLAGGSATTGDTAEVQGGPVWLNGLWHDTGAAHDDILRLSRFFTTRGLALGSMRSANGLLVAGTRAYALAGERDIVVYAAAGGSISLSLPTGTWDATRYDPRTGTTTSLASASGSARWSFSSLDWVVQLRRR